MLYESFVYHNGKLNLKDYDEVISLGTCCESTFLIRKFNLSKPKKSYPFDWVSLLDPSMVINAIVNDFDGYTSESNLEKIINPYTGLEQLSNLKYRFIIPHHTKEEFIEKYTQKIQNWRYLDKKGRKLFILKCHSYSRVSNDNIYSLLEILVERYGDIHLFVMREYREEEDLLNKEQLVEIINDKKRDKLFVIHIVNKVFTCSVDKQDEIDFWKRYIE